MTFFKTLLFAGVLGFVLVCSHLSFGDWQFWVILLMYTLKEELLK